MSFDPIEEDVLHHEIFSDWRYLECKFGLELAFVQFQYVKHAIPAYLHLKVPVLIKNCCKMDIRFAYMCKLRVYYDNGSLIDTIYPPKQKFRLSQHAANQVPLTRNTKSSRGGEILETKVQISQTIYSELRKKTR